MANNVTAKVANGKLIITIDMNSKPEPSASGKTLIVATTGGFTDSGAKTANGKPISISINATVRP